MALTIEKTIAELADHEKPLLGSNLAKLSDLSSEELEIFEHTWLTIKPERRKQILSRLVGLAKDNFELDFDNIFKLCLKDQDAEVRNKAIQGLWESEEVSLINPLIKLLEQDTSEKVQSVAATALGKFALLAELRKLRPSHATNISRALLSVITDRNKPTEVKRRALEAAAPLSLPQVSKAIMEAYQSHDPKLRASAIYAMGKNCNSSWLPTLLTELDSTNAKLRYEATKACGELGEEKAVPRLIGLINDPDIEIQLAAIQALGKIRGDEAEEPLQQCLTHADETIREAAQQALKKLEAEEDPFSFRA